jgi:ankyrin repeat protein
LKAGADANAVNLQNGLFPLLWAAQNGHRAVVTVLLKAGADANAVDPQDGLFPLLLAAKNGHSAVVTALLKAGADAWQQHTESGLSAVNMLVLPPQVICLEQVAQIIGMSLDAVKAKAAADFEQARPMWEAYQRKISAGS